MLADNLLYLYLHLFGSLPAWMNANWPARVRQHCDINRARVMHKLRRIHTVLEVGKFSSYVISKIV
jgi:hypothetical protein